MWKAFQTGIQIGLSHWRVAILVYAIQLLVAMIFGLQVGSLISSTIGDSLSIDALIEGYDHTVFSDFMAVHGASFGVLMSQMKWVLLLGFFLSVFLQAGKYSAVVRQEFYWPAFFEGARQYFWSFLKIAFVVILFTIVWTLVCWLPLMSNLLSALETLPSEVDLGWIAFAVLLVYMFGLVILTQISILAKTHVISESGSVRQAFRAALRWMRTHFFSNTGLYLLFNLLAMTVGLLYLWIELKGGMISTAAVYGFLIIQQAYSFGRILLNLMKIGGLSRYYVEGNSGE